MKLLGYWRGCRHWRGWKWCCGAAALLCSLAMADDQASVLRLDTADAVLQPDGLPEQHRRVALPHRWDREFEGRSGRAVYTLQLPPLAPLVPLASVALVAPVAPQMLLLEHVANQATVSVDGVTLKQLGTLGDATLDAGRLTHTVLVPATLLSATRASELRIEVSVQPLRSGGLSPVRFGPLQAVEAQQAARQLREQSASAAYAASLLLMGGLAGGLWWRQRDALYGCFALAALFGAARHLDQVWQLAFLPWPARGAVLAICYGLHLGLIGRFVLLMLGRNPPWLVRGLYAALFGVVALASLSFALLKPGLWTAALAVLEAVGLACFGVVLHEAVVARRAAAGLLVAAGGLLLAAGSHDILLVRMGLFGGSDFPLTPHAMFFVVMILAGLVVVRYSRSVADYRALSEHLAERVAERERQLRDAFEDLRTQQQEQAVLGERQRIMREIHDGIGSQLVGLLGMVGVVGQAGAERSALVQQVNLALDEMRMAVDSLQPVHNDLTTVLATLRYRLQPRLDAAGIQMQWDVAALPPMHGLSPQAILHLQRILLEAFTNVLKHARASRVSVVARWHGAPAPRVVFRLLDNGVGLPNRAAQPPEPAAPRGQGIANMQARARAIDAELRVENAPGGGACVTLEWQLPVGDAMAPADVRSTEVRSTEVRSPAAQPPAVQRNSAPEEISP